LCPQITPGSRGVQAQEVRETGQGETSSEREPSPAGTYRRLGSARFQNFGQVLDVAFSGDGKRLAAAAWDGSIHLWEMPTGAEVRQWPGHRGWVRSVAFSSDGNALATGGKDRDIVLWESNTGKELRRFVGHKGEIYFVSFSPDGKVLASLSLDDTLRLWDVAAAQEIRRLGAKRNTSRFHCLCKFAFSHDGKWLASAGGFDDTDPNNEHYDIYIWEVHTGRELGSLAHRGPGAIAISPDDTILAAGGWGTRTIRFWGADTRRALPDLQTPDLGVNARGVSALVFSPDGKTLASASTTNMIYLWEMASRQERCRFQDPQISKICLAFSPDGRFLVSGSIDTTVLLWDL
jgi:WD40 repeat protein